MSTFKSRSAGRVHVHTLPSTRFRTKDLSIRLHTPLTRETVTSVAMLPYMWMNGTSKHPSTRDLSIASDELYGTIIRTSLSKRGAYQVLEISASIPDVSSLTDEEVVTKAADLACEVLVDHVRGQVAFSSSAVAQEIDLHKRRIEAVRDDKMGYALQRCMAEVAADSAVALPRLGMMEDLSGLTPDALYDAYESVLQSCEANVYLVGPYTDADALADKLIQQLQRVLPGDSLRAELRVDALAVDGQSVRTVKEAQDVMQAQLDVGYRTGVNLADKKYPALVMMNGVLGGFAHSKLFQNVREKNSLAYTVWSHLDGMTGILAVMTGIEPSKYQQALDIIQEQLVEIQHGHVTDEEMLFTYRGLKNQYTVWLDQPSALANLHYNGILAGKPREVADMLEALSSISKEDVVQAAASLQPHTIYFLTGEEDA